MVHSGADERVSESMFLMFFFPECVAKGSRVLSWGSGGCGLFAGRCVSRVSNLIVALSMGIVRKGDVV